MNKDNTLLSICVPVYNTETYLKQCIDSVINQNYDNWELILIDDCSDDNSYSICKHYQLTDKRIKTFRNDKNGGQLYSRQQAILKAEGQYCIFVDSDDYLVEGALRRISDYILEYNADCIVYGLEVEDNRGKIEEWTVNKKMCFSTKRDFYLTILSDIKMNSMCRKAFKRELIYNEIINNDNKIIHGEDLLQSMYLLSKCSSVVVVPSIMYHYRFNPQSVSHRNDYSNYRPYILLREKILLFLKNENCLLDSDWKKYRVFATDSFISIVVGICCSSLGRDRIIGILESLRNEKYSKWICKTRIKDLKFYKNILLFLFNKKRLLLLYCLSMISEKLKKIHD